MATKTAASKSGATKSKKSTSAKKAAAKPKKQPWKSRAAIRLVEPGSQVDCVVCGERVKFQARMRNQQVICNIYTKGVWERVDHYHADCYKEAKRPYGKPTEKG